MQQKHTQRTMTVPEAIAQLEDLYGAIIRTLTPDHLLNTIHGSDASSKWHEAPDWEDMDDLVLLEETNFKEAASHRQVMVVAEVVFSRTKRVPIVQGQQLLEYARTHLENLGECLFNGDLVLVSLDDASMWVFHHDGLYAKVTKPARI